MNVFSRRAAVPFAVLALLAILLIYGSTQSNLPAAFAGMNRINRKPALRLLPLGDSITEGYMSSDKNGYRLHLKDLLRRGGFSVEFIGSLTDGVGNPDNKHEGWGAHSIDQIYARVQADDILSLGPNLVLLHAGTNDMDRSPPGENEPYDSAPARLGKLIDMVLQQCPETFVLLATIIQDDHAGVQPRIDAFNAAIPGVVASKRAKGFKIAMVDQKDIGGTDLVDMIHPTDHGYKLMAKNWFHAIEKIPTKDFSPVIDSSD